MADIVNLRRARKRADRAHRERDAEQSRIVHGLPTAMRRAEAFRQDRERLALDGHKLEKPESP